MNQLILMVKKNYKTILKVICGLLFLYIFILIATRKPKIPSDIKSTIDSLTNINKQLLKKQKQIDSTIAVYEIKVNEVDFQIDNIKEKTTIIREYYHEVGQQTDKYTPSQIDLFFKIRYNY